MHQAPMSYKFSPKFTIATAYPMMFSSDDLRYIETEMLHATFADSGTSYHLADPAVARYFDTIETPTELYRWTQKEEFQRIRKSQHIDPLGDAGPDDLA